MFDVTEPVDQKSAREGNAKLVAFYAEIGIPKNLREVGVEEDKLAHLAGKSTENGEPGILVKIGKEEALDIFKMA